MSENNSIPTVLHVGSGGHKLPEAMQHCKETTLDISPGAEPDILADMADLPPGIGPFDCVWSCHCLEHLPFHKHQECLRGWLNVLRPGGVVQIVVPDLEGLVLSDEVLYNGINSDNSLLPVTAWDMVYGHRALTSLSPYMQHFSGFTAATLRAALEQAGFVGVRTARLGDDQCRNLWAIGLRPNE